MGMSAGNPTSMVAKAVEIEPRETLQVDCYVRPAVPAAVTEPISGVVDRLRELDESGRVGDYRVFEWPPEQYAVDDLGDETQPTRDELVAEFERWAARRGHSLEPAFKRLEVPSSPFGLETDDTLERIRVPLVALALREADADAKTEALRGVVPYTERPGTAHQRTHTVEEWLTGATKPEPEEPPQDRRRPRVPQPEGGR